MKYVLTLVAILTVAFVSPAMAGDGHVPKSTLNALGLSGMEQLSDAAGLQVRGLSSNAKASGMSLVFGALVDPHTGSFVAGNSVDFSKATAENAGLNSLSQAAQNHISNLGLSLNVITGTSSFSGVIIGGAGGSSQAFAF